MSSQDFVRSSALNNIPSKKVLEYLTLIQNSESDISKRNIKTTAINRYVESNIPIQYWSLKMEKDFIGDQNLLNKYKEYTSDLKSAYTQGRSICFSGSHGLGKSMTTCCILKKACEKGFTCLYSTLSDIVNVMIQASGEDKFLSRRELMLVDFLVIDEFDSRFIGSDNARCRRRSRW
jgi:DNA replication protein DnaC